MPDWARLDVVRAISFLLDRTSSPERVRTGELALRLAELSRRSDGGTRREI